MNNRERIINTVLCKKVDRLPFIFYFPPWDETIERWKNEGLDECHSWDEGLGTNPGIILLQEVNLGYFPIFQERVIEEKNDTLIVIDNMGLPKKLERPVPPYLNILIIQ